CESRELLISERQSSAQVHCSADLLDHSAHLSRSLELEVYGRMKAQNRSHVFVSDGAINREIDRFGPVDFCAKRLGVGLNRSFELGIEARAIGALERESQKIRISVGPLDIGVSERITAAFKPFEPKFSFEFWRARGSRDVE